MSELRFDRQVRFAPIGSGGQRRIRAATVAVIGCGALGCAVAEQLARAGVGRLRLVDRDFVDATNLHRQGLFDADDAAHGRAKAAAAARRLAAIAPLTTVEPVVASFHAGNALHLIAGCDLAIDGLDNFPGRHVLNEACCSVGLPWVHGACVGAYGQSAAFIPGDGPCLRCLQDELPGAGESPTCDTAGIIPPAVQLVAAWQAAEALKLLVGDRAALRRELWACDLWRGSFQRLRLNGVRDPACRACGADADRPALAAGEEQATALCGRDAVQIAGSRPADLPALARQAGDAAIAANEDLVRIRDGTMTITVFADGRAIVHGTGDSERARVAAARWLS